MVVLFCGSGDTRRSDRSQNQSLTLNESPRSRPQCSLASFGLARAREGAWGSRKGGHPG